MRVLVFGVYIEVSLFWETTMCRLIENDGESHRQEHGNLIFRA